MSHPSTTALRTDLYTAVHKGQRFRLFQLGARAGSTDPSDAGAITTLGDMLAAMIRELRDHAHHEETFIHPLLAERLPEVGAALESRHHELEVWMDDLLAAFQHARRAGALGPDAGAAEALALYRSLMQFIARYLDHLGEGCGSFPAQRLTVTPRPSLAGSSARVPS